jgi:hypothetical protein
MCERAYDGDLEAMETLFRRLATAERNVGLYQASRSLMHFLNGTTTPGSEHHFPRSWYLNSPDRKGAEERDKMMAAANNIILKRRPRAGLSSSGVVVESSSGINFDPLSLVGVGYPDDRQLVLGAHTLHVRACYLWNGCTALVMYKFGIYEWYDFRKGENNTFDVPGTGIKMPTYWLDQLADNNMAAEYWAIVEWTELGLLYLR